MPILVRDAATPHHAVIGLAAISSPVVQIAERDTWMGWETDHFLREHRGEPDGQGRPLDRRPDQDPERRDLRCGPAAGRRHPADRHEHESRPTRPSHGSRPMRSVTGRGTTAPAPFGWSATSSATPGSMRAETLPVPQQAVGGAGRGSRYRRCTWAPTFEPKPTVGWPALEALDDPKARAQLRRVVRRARGERVGTVIADLTVCGAVAPYNALAAGKLVGALAVSPTVLAAYRKKYSRPSEIASAMAGRAIEREARLSFIGTTSLYGTGSSQYNRLFWPAVVMGGESEAKHGLP